MKFMKVEVAVAAIIEEKGKILLTKRTKSIVDGGKWCLPGGHLKKWEKSEDAVKREVNEEIGLKFKKSKLLFVNEEFVKRLNLHAVVFVYKFDFSGRIKKNWEVKEFGWFARKEIGKMDLAFTHKEMLNKYWGMK